MAKGPSPPQSSGNDGSTSPILGGTGTIATNKTGNNTQILGMIVDRSSFDDGNDFSNFVINEEDGTLQTEGVGSGVVMKNGKVRRRLRWKPPAFRKKKANSSPSSSNGGSNVSSNGSVISALTNRSNTTNRSNSTNKTFLSGFSRTSTKSFHTFHSTATPVVTNKAGAKNQTKFPLPRPNYRDTFDDVSTNTKHSTIANEGQILQRHRRRGSDKALFNVGEVDVERCTTLTSRLDSMPPSPTSHAPSPRSSSNLGGSGGGRYSGSNASVHSDPFDNLEPSVVAPCAAPPKPTRKLFLPRPPRMLKKKLGLKKKKDKDAATATASAAEDSLTATASSYSHKSNTDGTTVTATMTPSKDYPSSSEHLSNIEAKHTAPTIATSKSRPSLSGSISMERENSVLPRLVMEDYEEDRRVGLCIGTPARTILDYEEDLVDGHVHGTDATAGGASQSSMMTPSSRSSPSPTPSFSGGGGGGPRRPGQSNSPQTKPLDRRAGSNVSNIRSTSSQVEAAVTPVRSIDPPTGQTPPQRQQTPPQPKAYNRPVDMTTSISRGGGVEITANNENEILVKDETKGRNGFSSNSTPNNEPTRFIVSPGSTSVPCDVDQGVFVEAEHNLRAIHDMAAEHLAHGEFTEAIEVFEEILRGQQERYGPNHYRVGTALHNLGIVHLKSGDHQKAIEVCSQAVKVRRESLVPDHPDVAVSLAQLGVAHLECRQFERALMAFREALHIRQTFLGPMHPKCSKILNNIGCAMYALDELEGSRLAFQEALDIQRETLRTLPPPGTSAGEDAQEVTATSQSNQILLSIASTLCNIGSIRLRWGQFDDAAVALEEALLIQQSVLGDEHPMVASTTESIEYVERSKENSIPSATDLLSRWVDAGDDAEFKQNNMMCSAGASSDRVLTNLKAFMTTKSWYGNAEERFVDSACGGPQDSSEEGSSNGPSQQDTEALTEQRDESGAI